MNCLKKHPAYFSLNLGKLHNGDNGQNPKINYLRLYDNTDILALKAETGIFQEFVLDCTFLNNSTVLKKFLDKFYNLLKEDFTVRTLLVKDNTHNNILMEFLEYIRIIESADLASLQPFAPYKTRLECKTVKDILAARQERYYIYRRASTAELLLPFSVIKTTHTQEYDITYYEDADFIYSTYREKVLH